MQVVGRGPAAGDFVGGSSSCVRFFARLRPSRCASRLGFLASSIRPRDDQIPLAQLAAPARPLRPAAGGASAGRRAGRSPPRCCAASAGRAAGRRSGGPRGRRPGRGRSPASAGRRTGRGTRPSGRGSAAPARGTACRRAAARMRSMICSRVWAVIGRPHCGQWPLPDAGVQHAQIVVDLGDRADGRARVLPAGLLRDRDRRAQARDQIDVGLGHLARETAGRSWTGSRRSAAAPRHTACRRPASSCPTRSRR